MKIKKILSAVLCSSMIIGLSSPYIVKNEVSAASDLVIDCSAVEEQPHRQFYYSDEDEFFIDGINVYYNDTNVTGKSKFIFNTSPASTYDGKNNDYVIPFTVEYTDDTAGKITATGQMNACIGLRGDANCDNKLDKNDVILIENDLYLKHISNKSSLASGNGLGLFLANVDGIQDSESTEPFGYDDLNIADAFYLNSYLESGSHKSLYEHILLMNASKPTEGSVSLSTSKGTNGNTANIYLSCQGDSSIGAFDVKLKWDISRLDLISVTSCNDNVTVFSALSDGYLEIWGFGNEKLIENGEVAVLEYGIPKDISTGQVPISVYDVEYIGVGSDFSVNAVTSNGSVMITDKSNGTTYKEDNYMTDEKTDYDYGIRLWSTDVDYGTEQVELPLILLGKNEYTGLSLKVECDPALSVDELSKAVYITEKGKSVIAGEYSSTEPLGVELDVLKVKIAKNTYPGKYYITLTADNFEGNNISGKKAVLSGYVNIKAPDILYGDANLDDQVNIRDAAYIAVCIIKKKVSELPMSADYNKDGTVNIRDAAAIAKMLVSK